MSTKRVDGLERPTASGLLPGQIIERFTRYGVAPALTATEAATGVSAVEIVSRSQGRRATSARAALVHALRDRAWSYRDIAALLDRDAASLHKLAAKWPRRA